MHDGAIPPGGGRLGYANKRGIEILEGERKGSNRMFHDLGSPPASHRETTWRKHVAVELQLLFKEAFYSYGPGQARVGPARRLRRGLGRKQENGPAKAYQQL